MATIREALSRLRLRLMRPKRLRNPEDHFRSARAVAYAGFQIAVYSKPESAPCKLDPRTETNCPFFRIPDILAVDLMFRQLL